MWDWSQNRSSKAATYYRAAADLGYVPAMTNVGHCYKAGEGVTKSRVKAMEYFLRRAEGGDREAMYYLATCYGKK